MIRPKISSRCKHVVIDIDTQSRFFPDNGKAGFHDNGSVLANIRRVIAWTRLKRIFVVSTIQISSNNSCSCDFREGGNNGIRKIGCTLRNRRTLFDATDCTDLPLEIFDRYDQLIFCKRCIDPFEEPRIDRMLTELEVDEFILIGSLAEGAIKATALGLLARGKNVRILVDAVRSDNKGVGRKALRQVWAKGAKLIDTRKLLGFSALRLATVRPY